MSLQDHVITRTKSSAIEVWKGPIQYSRYQMFKLPLLPITFFMIGETKAFGKNANQAGGSISTTFRSSLLKPDSGVALRIRL